MNYRIIRPEQLTADDIAAWSRLQHGDATLESPFFRPEFTQAVAAVRNDVEVAVADDGETLVGFLPFQRGPGGVGRPVGAGMSDYQGLIARPDVAIEVTDLLRACGLRAWSFDHLLACQPSLVAYHQRICKSPFLDLTQGFDAYRANRVNSGSDEITHTLRKGRKLDREVGPLRFEFRTTADEVFAQLVAWKRQQYRQTKVPDALAPDWVVPLLRGVMHQQSNDFSGVLSALYAGPHLVAVHLGIAAGAVLHYWFPAYDPAYFKYSPGSVLLMRLAQEGTARGFTRIDLGKGEETYKSRFASGQTLLAEGSVDLRPVGRAIGAAWWRTRNWVRQSRFRAPAKAAWQWMRPVRQWLSVRS